MTQSSGVTFELAKEFMEELEETSPKFLKQLLEVEVLIPKEEENNLDMYAVGREGKFYVTFLSFLNSLLDKAKQPLLARIIDLETLDHKGFTQFTSEEHA